MESLHDVQYTQFSLVVRAKSQLATAVDCCCCLNYQSRAPVSNSSCCVVKLRVPGPRCQFRQSWTYGLTQLQPSTTQLLIWFPAVGWGRNQRRRCEKNSCFEIKVVLITKTKAVHLRKARQGIHSVPISGQVFSILTTAGPHHMQ